MKTNGYYEYIAFSSLSAVIILIILLFAAGLFTACAAMTAIVFVMGPLLLFIIEKITQFLANRTIAKRAAR